MKSIFGIQNSLRDHSAIYATTVLYRGSYSTVRGLEPISYAAPDPKIEMIKDN